MSKIYRFFAHTVRNWICRKTIQQLHSALRTGDLAQCQLLLLLSPHFYDVRNIASNLETVLHAAIQSGSIDLIKYLNPTPWDVLNKDGLGNSSIHHVSSSPCDVDVAKYLWLVLNEVGSSSSSSSSNNSSSSSSSSSNNSNSSSNSSNSNNTISNRCLTFLNLFYLLLPLLLHPQSPRAKS